MHDLAIIGGTVHDGLGSPGLRADVAIEHVVLGGTVVVDNGGFTGARAGVVLRAGASQEGMP